MLCELSVGVHYLSRSFTNDDETHDDGLLGALVLKEIIFSHTFHKAACIRRGLLHMVKVVGQAILTHTG
ncbi:hypothetical protein SAMN05216404_1357 [Nitrosospira multiformis]|uniref:Uncharacterized protein n=1 Tax=Nitrosospira multiformis TaxID=1231 RepID=A0A1H8QFH6_9PROT|nr:hypothetical protein SAMN05216404_1357 [Nitrosospira multiformis]